jgi:glycosyltransferase involved in cell wall biosynthesis
MPPVVSIVMPTFNRLDFLPAAVQSVFAQTFTQWELLIADDGSAATTRAYLESVHRPPRSRVMWLAHTGSPALTRNAALHEARGEYVAFLDSDDLWEPRKLEIQLQSLRVHPTRTWSCSAFALVDAADVQVAQRSGPRCAPSGWVREALLRGECTIHLSSVLASRQLLAASGLFDAAMGWCTDLELWFRLAARGELDGIDERLTRVRRHAQHSCDDTTALADYRLAIEKVLVEDATADLRAVLQRRRAALAGQLARSHALAGAGGGALATLASSARYAWRYREWWQRAFEASALALAPRTSRAAVNGFRRVRTRLRSAVVR